MDKKEREAMTYPINPDVAVAGDSGGRLEDHTPHTDVPLHGDILPKDDGPF